MEAPPQQTLKGHCLCGNISVTLTVPEKFLSTAQGHLCHCSNCRKFSSSLSGINCLMVGASQVHLSDPHASLKIYHDSNTRSGRSVPRSFCGNCGSAVGSIAAEGMAQISIVGLGLFDQVLAPKFECFVKNRPHFVAPLAGREGQFDGIEEVWGEVEEILKREQGKADARGEKA